VGGAIGAALDEEDRQQMALLTQESIVTGEPREYTSPRTNAHVDIHIVKSTTVAHRLCRTAAQDVTLKDGATSSETSTSCRGPDKTWVADS
jgi:surface antigen